MITISTYLKNPVSCLTDFWQPYSNESENKNNVASCLWSISDRTNASTEKTYTSYKSPNTQLLWAWGTRAWHTHGGPTPTSLQNFTSFLSEVVEAMWGWWSEKIMFYMKSPYLTIPKIIDFILVSLIHEKMLVWNASIWVDWPCM